MAALSESAARMRGEPEAERTLWPDYGRLIASAYTTAAQIVTVRLMIRIRRAELDAGACEKLLDETRRAVLAELDLGAVPPKREADPDDTPADADAFAVLRQRCGQVLSEAADLREIALRWTQA